MISNRDRYRYAGISARQRRASRFALMLHAALLVVLCLLAASDTHAVTPLQNDRIINVVNVSSIDVPMIMTSVSTVNVIVRTRAVIDFLQYSPALPGSPQYVVAQGAYRPGANPAAPFLALVPPRMVGAPSPIDLSLPVPLTHATQYHQGDPVFIKVTDFDNNLDPNARESVFVTLTVNNSGDVEVIRLVETGLNTGEFVGYVPTGNAATVLYNGNLQVSEGSVISARYIDRYDNSDTTASAVMVDPFGIVLDTKTGLPVNGATIIIVNNATGLPAIILGDDGASSYPATLTSGGTARDSSGKLYNFPPGGYRFPFAPSGIYRYDVKPPTGYTAPSVVDTAAILSLPGGPFSIVPGSRGEIFSLNSGPALRIDIPLDPASTSLWIQKSVNKQAAGVGDFLSYDLSVTNNSRFIPVSGVRILDIMPTGFRFRKGSVLLNGKQVADPLISTDGQTLTFAVGTLAPEGSAVIRFVTEIAAGSRLGQSVNYASAIGDGGASSNIAKAMVVVRDDLLRTRSILMGRVTSGVCPEKGAEPETGQEGVRIYLEDGTFAVSDKDGLFHFEGIRPGLHVVQLDLDSLPDGYEALPCNENSRFAGRAFSQFIELQGGSLWRADFHVGRRTQAATPETGTVTGVPEIGLPAKQVVAEPPTKGQVGLELANHPAGNAVNYDVSMHGGGVPVKDVRLKVALPSCSSYVLGSTRLDGSVFSDPEGGEAHTLIYRLGDMPAEWARKLSFSSTVSAECKNVEMGTRAYLAFITPKGTKGLTAPAETSMEQTTTEELHGVPDIVVRPQFPSFGAELSPTDKGELDDLALLLKGLRTSKIHVTGHTDNVPISHRGKRLYQDNTALSWARARSVGRYLMDALHFPPEKLSIDGRGDSTPIAKNSSEAARALNRRVEVRAIASSVIERSKLNIIKELSGPLRVETEGDAPSTVISPAPSAVLDEQKSNAQLSVAPAAVAAAASVPLSSASGTVSPVVSVGSSVQPLQTQSTPVAGQAVSQSAPKSGFVNIVNGDKLVNRINAVHIRLDGGLTPKFTVDGTVVPETRIGFRGKDVDGKTRFGFLGVDIGEPGQHVLEVTGLDPFGNQRFSERLTVMRTGDVSRIRVLQYDGNVADGKTPVRLRVELYDNDGNLLRGTARLALRNTTLKPLVDKKETLSLDDATSATWVDADREGWLLFQPVSASGSYRVILAHNLAVAEAETYVRPKMRDWILVGLAEGTLGYNTVSGNMENLKAGEADDDFYKDGRVAFFAKGQIKGEWLVTTSYDTAKSRAEVGNSLFQDIDPDSYYTLYGDATQQQYDAASSRKLYIKVERDKFYAMYGDYDTGLTITELSRYSRRMTGVKTEFQSNMVEVNAFASETTQAYLRDEIPGDGTSGLYHLSRRDLIFNSEKVTIMVRDRYRSEVVISSRYLSRFVDYSIDYDAGTIFFKQPVMSRDEHFNPITILVEYEAKSDVGSDYTYGGRAGIKLLDKHLKIGVSHVHEGLGDKKNNLYGVDSTIQLTENTRLRAELAATESQTGAVNSKGNAYIAELLHSSKKLNAKAYIREQWGTFGLGQQMGSESGTRKFGVEGNYRLNEKLSIAGNVYRQSNLTNGSDRNVAEGKISYGTKLYSTSLGLLGASDRLVDGRTMTSGQVTLGGRVLTLQDRLTLTVDHAQSVWGNANVDFPTRTTYGVEYKINPLVSLFGAQEFTWGSAADTNATRAGVRSTPWNGGTVSSSVERQIGENNSRVFANVGLRQTIQLTDEWKVDAGLDRSYTFQRKSSYSVNAGVPAASGSSDDFTAISSGATYQVKALTWDSRFEYRTSSSEDKWGILSGMVKEQGDGLAWSARGQYFQNDMASGQESRRANLRLGFVYRPPVTRWIHLDRFDVIHEGQHGGGTEQNTSWRLVNNYTFNYKPLQNLQVSLKYGAKYVMDTISLRQYSAYTDHSGSETRYDLTSKWDVGLRGSLLHSWSVDQYAYSGGGSTGYNVMDNVWVSIGYNLWGFSDKDFSAADYTAQGPYVRFRMKFDQQTVKDAAAWLSKQ